MLPREFLSQIADKYGLPQDQKEVFLEKFGNDKSNQDIASTLNIVSKTVDYHLGKIYKKFGFGGKGTGKAHHLLSFLITESQKFNPLVSPSSNADAEPTQNKQQDTNEIDALVQEVRSRIHDKIQYQCGTMRMLDISHPVVLSDIYTDVNILEQITSQQWRDIPDLLKDFNPESDDFDTLGHGKRLQRLPGLDAVSRYSKLMLLGKPGAGKTTFLQWVAIKCDLGEFQLDRVPIFIRLKNFAEDTRRDDSEFKLLNYISQEFSDCGIADKSVIEMILIKGKALILLDGLDEVSEEDDEVVKQIRRLVNKYFKNKFIITCRTGVQKYRFSVENFTDVVVADFNDEQVEVFAKKWFVAVARNDREQGEATARRFIEKLILPENKQIRELAGTPILLNLTCFVFQTKGEFPQKRFKLYKQGLDILLRKWDEERDIQRDEVYRNLSLEQKIELLTQIAAITFTNSRYFFEQEEVERYIADYISTLPNAQTNRAILQRDSKRVLKSIEAQHGLLVERMREIYSFSHLTFQEYFTAKWFVERTDWKGLMSHISEKGWREVFLLSFEIIKPADSLLLLMKRKIHGLVAEDDKLQKFLGWVDEKARSVDAPYKLVAVRAFYTFEFDLIRPLDRNLSWDLASHYEPAIDPDFERAYDDWLLELQERETFKYWDNYSDNDPTSNPGYSSTLTATSSLQDRTPFNYDLALDLALDQILAKDFDLIHAESLAFELDLAIPHALDSQLQQKLQGLRTQLSASMVETWENWEQWWKSNGQAWIEQLRAIMIEHRNIGHHWQFNDAQKQLLQQYYDANKLLVDCLNSDCVSREIKQETEDTLLLPMEEIEKRQQRIL